MEVFTRWSDKARVYRCATHRRKGPSICANTEVIEMRTAHAAVLAVAEQALDPELLAAVVDRTAEKLAGQANRRTQVEAQLSNVEAQIRRATSAILAGGELPPLVEALRELEKERQRLERKLKARSATFDRVKLRQALLKHAKDWRAMLRRRAENARSILRKFVAERFVFTPNPAGGYLFRGTGISAYYFKWRPQREVNTFGTGRFATGSSSPRESVVTVRSLCRSGADISTIRAAVSEQSLA
jgi:hypothetical protein